mmetsp:Transcript_70358/g.114285  ORF Transcript_70358/g.114285 Transcript_70358/m.114285 type:complete len:528 (-) Transcript_70358:41-1624(-)
MLRAGNKGGGGGKVDRSDDQSREVVPLSLQKLRDLAESLKASMPVDIELLDDKTSPLKSKALTARSKSTNKPRRNKTAVDDKQSTQNQLNQLDTETLQIAVGQVENKYESLSGEHNAMLIDAKKQQQDYIRREVQYKSQMKRMKELLDKAEESRGGEDVGMPKLRETHKKIVEQLRNKQSETRNIIAEQEQDVIKLFRQQLFEVESKLKKNTSKKTSEAVGGVPRAWLDKSTNLARDLEHFKEESIRFDSENERLQKETSRLLGEHRSHEDDIQYLESQMASLKKENHKLKKDLEEAATASMRAFLSMDSSTLAPQAPDEDSATPAQPSTATEEELSHMCAKTRENIVRVRKLIDDERGRLRQVRTAHVAAFSSRAELEGFLADCLSDVDKQISRHQIEAADAIMAKSAGRAHIIEERDRVLELLMSQKRVISLLIERTFPHKSQLAAYGGPRIRDEDESLLSTGGEDVTISEADALLANYADDLNLNEAETKALLNDAAWASIDGLTEATSRASGTTRATTPESIA